MKSARTFWVRLSTEERWDFHLRAFGARDAAVRFAKSRPLADSAIVEVTEAKLMGTPESGSFTVRELMALPEPLEITRPDNRVAAYTTIGIGITLGLVAVFVPRREGASSPFGLLAIAALVVFWGLQELAKVQKKSPPRPPEDNARDVT